MKRIILFLTVAVLAVTACSDKFFDLYPTDSMTSDNYMNNVSEIGTVLDAAYAGMRGDFGNAIVYIGDLPTDNAYDYKLNNSSAHISLSDSTVDSQNSVIGGLWYACYQIINRCCLVLESLDALENVPEARYNDLAGQAKFLRGYVYYVMARVWGDVPLVLEDIKDYMKVFEYGRTPVDQVYKQIVEDLKDAESKLPDFRASAEKGRVTATAAQAILADVYLTRGDYATAKGYFEKVIAKEGANLGLLDNYASIFDANNVNNKEVIFAIQYAHNQTPSLANYLGRAALGNINGQYVDPAGQGESRIFGVNVLMMTHELEAKFSADDKRRSVVYTGVSSPDYGCTIPMTLKYFDYQNVADGNSGNNPDCGCHTIISRHSDILLKYAECLVETGDLPKAIDQLKRVRTRAGLDTDVEQNKDAVKKAIADERQLELCMEGHRWFDLVRTGMAISTMTTWYSKVNAPALHKTIMQYEYGDNQSIDQHELIYPIPYAQVELNPDKLKQNPGY